MKKIWLTFLSLFVVSASMFGFNHNAFSRDQNNQNKRFPLVYETIPHDHSKVYCATNRRGESCIAESGKSKRYHHIR